MEPRDITQEINNIAQKYHFAKEPGFIRDAKVFLLNVLRAIDDFIRELFRQHHSSIDSTSLSTVLQVLIWVATVVGLTFLVVSLVKRARRLTQAAQTKVRGAAEVEEIWDAGGWKKQAERLASDRDFKGACRALYLSLLQSIHEHGVAEFEPARTNYEYSYALAKHPELQKEFKVMAERVEVIWFGNRVAAPEDYGASVSDLDSMSGHLRKIQQERLQREAALTK